jgi:hypothetical protein
MKTTEQSHSTLVDPLRDGELASLYGVLDEVGASYPLLTYAAGADGTADEETPLDPVIFEGLVRP